MKNNKLFFKIYFSLVIICIITFIILYILGAKERVGYLYNFTSDINRTLELNGLNIEETKKIFTTDDKLDNDAIINYIFTNEAITNYRYGFKIGYYSKIFKNSDIYDVYPNVNKILEDNNFIKEAIMDEKGGPFGNLISEKTLGYNEKIDNINYKLRLKLKLILISIFIIVLIFILAVYYLILSLLNNIPRILIKMFNSNLYFIFSQIIIVIYIFFYKKDILYWDAVTYISRGIDIFYGRNTFQYPGTLFSIITTIPTMLIFGNTQLSYLYYISLIPTILTVVFSYKILTMYIDKKISVNILFFIFILFPHYISIMLSQTYTDGWLLMFIILSIYFMLNNKIYISAVLISIAYFFRSSQALPLGIFIPILLESNDNFKNYFSKKSIVSYIKYYLTLILMILAITLILNIFVKNDNSETTFYLFAFKNIGLKTILNSLFLVITGYRLSTVSILILSIISILLITRKNLSIGLKKLSFLGIIYSLICIFLTSLLVSAGIKILAFENRYFIYPILVLLLSVIALLYEYLSKYYDFNKGLNNILSSIFLLLIIIKIMVSVNISSALDNIKMFDYSTDYPKIEENINNVYMMHPMAPGVFNYIFKNQTYQPINTKALTKSFEDFCNNDNHNYKYIFSMYNLGNIITDKYGNTFELIWSSNLVKGYKYSLYKNKEYSNNNIGEKNEDISNNTMLQ